MAHPPRLSARRRITWTYDADDRLVAETRDQADTNGDFGTRETHDYTDAFAYDLASNRMRLQHGWDADGDGKLETGEPVDSVITYTYNSRDELTAEQHDTDGDGKVDSTINYSYDDNGSMTAAGSNTYTWDLRGRMISATVDSVTTTYAYDSNGVRVKETTASDSTRYLNDANNPTGYTKAVEEWTSANGGQTWTLSRSYVLGHDVIAQADTLNGTLYLLHDGHGSTRAVLDSSGAVDEYYDYNAFSTLRNAGGQDDASEAKTRWLFGGDGVYDPGTGWTYHLARWRDGFRFVSMDSYAGDSQDPRSLHKYLYASANPATDVDPTGHFIAEAIALTGVAIQIGGAVLTAYGLAQFVVNAYEYVQATYGLMTTDASDGDRRLHYLNMQSNARQGMLFGLCEMAGGTLAMLAGGVVFRAGLAMMATGTAALVQFGNNADQYAHTFRHVQAAGLEPGLVQAAVEADLAVAASRVVAGQPFNQTIIVVGHQITYTAYRLADGTINVGRITTVP